jgi:hypothetical protein
LRRFSSGVRVLPPPDERPPAERSPLERLELPLVDRSPPDGAERADGSLRAARDPPDGRAAADSGRRSGARASP